MHSATAQETCTIHNRDCVHYSIKQDLNSIKCFENQALKDSILIEKDNFILKQSDFIKSTDIKVLELDKLLLKTESALFKMKKKRKRAYFIGGGIGILATILGFMAFG